MEMEDYDVYVVEKEYNPQALYDYVNYDDADAKKKKDLFMKAQKHLYAMGWFFYYMRLKSGKRELRYCPPNRKKKYSSLKVACRDCLHNKFPDFNYTHHLDAHKNDAVQISNQSFLTGDAQNHHVHPKPLKKLKLLFSGLDTPTNNQSDGVFGYPSNKPEADVFTHNHTQPPKQLKGVHNHLPTINLGQDQTNGVYSKPVKKLRFVDNDFVTQEKSQILRVYTRKLNKLKAVNNCSKNCNSGENQNDDAYKPNELPTERPGQNHNTGGYYKPKVKLKVDNNNLATLNCDDAVYNKPLKKLKGMNNVLVNQNIGYNGVSDKQMEGQKGVNNDIATQNLGHQNDDICLVCLYGGELILCDKCPSAFHASCIGLMEIPNTEFWYCQACCCRICGRRHDAETTSSYKQCNQCEKQYHKECLRHYCVADSDKSEWFCSEKCRDISVGLRNLLGKPVLVGRNNLTWTILKNENYMNDAESTNNMLLHRALAVMNECFKFVKRGRDVVEDVIFSRKSELKRLDFGGFYTAILKKGNRVVTVATVRVFGEEVAEVPLVATRLRYRRQGMCKILMNVLEQKLMELGVEKLVLPAIPSVLDTWTGPSFGFSKMTEFDRWTLLNYTFLEFPGTVNCHKLLLEDETSSVMDSPSNCEVN